MCPLLSLILKEISQIKCRKNQAKKESDPDLPIKSCKNKRKRAFCSYIEVMSSLNRNRRKRGILKDPMFFSVSAWVSLCFQPLGSPDQGLSGTSLLGHFQLHVVSSGFVMCCHLLGLHKGSNWAALKLR